MRRIGVSAGICNFVYGKVGAFKQAASVVYPAFFKIFLRCGTGKCSEIAAEFSMAYPASSAKAVY